jgi:ubiquinone biosynthesis protein COQ4
MSPFDATRIRPLKALRALRALLRNPDDTAQVFTIISALSGGARERVLRRLQATPVGRRVLAEGTALAPLLGDRERLRRLPEGSLGREYLQFCERHGITAEGLVAASQQGDLDPEMSRAERLVRARMRDAHDLWHVVTGYQTDLIGEASVLAFTFAQTRNPGVGLIVLSAFFDARGDRSATRLLLIEAFLRGRSAEWLPAADWEALLERPLDQVRRELGVGAPPQYTPVWPHEVMSEKKAPALRVVKAA